jgi:hypothetical protein
MVHMMEHYDEMDAEDILKLQDKNKAIMKVGLAQTLVATSCEIERFGHLACRRVSQMERMCHRSSTRGVGRD